MKIVCVFIFSWCKYNQLFCWHHLQFCIKIFIDVFLPLTCSKLYIYVCIYVCTEWNEIAHKVSINVVPCFKKVKYIVCHEFFRYMSMSDMQIITWSNNGHILVTVRYVVFNHCCMLAASRAESSWYWNHTLCFTASDTFQATLIAQFPENDTFIEQSMCQQMRAHDNVSDGTTTNIPVEADSISTFVGSMGIIPHPEVPLVFEGTPTCKT